MSAFQVGDIVRHRLGGERMAVVALRPHGGLMLRWERYPDLEDQFWPGDSTGGLEKVRGVRAKKDEEESDAGT